MNLGDEQEVVDAVNLAEIIGDRDSITALLGEVATASTERPIITADSLREGSPVLDDEVVETFLDFLVVRGYANEDSETPDAVVPDFDRVFDLLIRGRVAVRVLEVAAGQRHRTSVEFVCTLPSRDPSFEDVDPVDFGMQQITTQLLSMCRNAEDELVLTSPFLESEGMEWLLPGLRGALERGVDVSLISRQLQTGQPNRQAVEDLFSSQTDVSGRLSVYDYYEPSADGSHPEYTLHSKILISDERKAYVGSANFTKYGFTENLEVGVVVSGSQVRRLVDLLANITSRGTNEIQIV